MAKKNGGDKNNYQPLKNPELIGQGEKKSLKDLAKEPAFNFKQAKENFKDMEQRRKEVREQPKSFVEKHRPERLKNQKDIEPNKDK